MRVAKLADNGLLLAFISAVVLYWGPGSLLPGSFVSSVASLTLLTFGGLTFSLYAVPAWQVLIHRRRDDLSSGSHLNVLGTFLLAAGLLWSGVYGLTWVYMGQPVGWAGTMSSNFGRALLGFGMFLTYIAPQTSPTGIRTTMKMWLWGAVVLAFATGFILATKLNGVDDFSRYIQTTGGLK
jgi:hypothetical protein